MSPILTELTESLRRSAPYRQLVGQTAAAVERLPVAAAGWVLPSLVADRRAGLLVVTPHESQALAFVQGARLGGWEVENFTAPSLTPYQATTASLRVRAQEVVALDRIVRGRVRFVVATPRSLFRRLPSRAGFEAEVLDLRPGTSVGLEDLVAALVLAGYDRRDVVDEVGEFAVRGGVVDCFPAGAGLPVRIEYFGDDVESVRSFDPGDQRSRSVLESARIPPVRLFSPPDALERLADRLEGEELGFEAARRVSRMREGDPFPGWENYLPLLADDTTTLSSWLGADLVTAVVEPEAVRSEAERYAADLERDFESRRKSGEVAVAPDLLEHSLESVLEVVGEPEMTLDALGSARGQTVDFGARATDLFHHQLPRFPAEVQGAKARGERVLVVVESSDHRMRVERLCETFQIPVGAEGVEFIEGLLDRGFWMPACSLSVFSEAQLFRRPPVSRRSDRRTTASFVSGLRDLKVGDFVVHQDHGIGEFAGLRIVEMDGRSDRDIPPILQEELGGSQEGEHEVLEIRYADDRLLLLPPSRLDLIQRYGGAEGVVPRLDRLGGTSWARAKERVRSGVRTLAVDLLKLYAARQLSNAPRLPVDSDLQRQFEGAFAYDPTADQIESIAEIKADLESDQPMDRLLCGDVGFGKTEVAMRSAFKVVDGGYQVAVLAPTTVLADQHFETFRERFSGFPVEIEMVSRFRSSAEIRRVRERVERGQVDILIGTHRLLSRDIEFARLGLLIVDEEQRFGVAQKEKLKDLRKDVHVLALTATPVPRTLQLSLAGVRDLSTIETPPRDRLAIETAIVPPSPELIREAVEYELDRGGQIYYVYNRIAGIGEMAARLEEICKGARVVVGHGQLDEGELARRMHAFKEGEFDLLLATTIIENGIDIPNVNTMIVHDAERFGLAQLYQLRGRVGRSSQLAYCYLLVPPLRTLSDAARQRLQAIREFTELGAGFRVAARDLEIRGAGDFLGAEQSGHIAAVGIETYLKLLDDAVRELRGESVEDAVSTTIHLPVTATIPVEYVGDTNLRMEMYHRIAASRDERELKAELEDRFGPPPQEVGSLIGIAALRHRAEELRIQSITGRARTLTVRFRHDTGVAAENLIRFVGENPSASFSPSGVLKVEGVDTSDWISASRNLLGELLE
jgi:transcription-repair coupling factor (superfamily II helicase)